MRYPDSIGKKEPYCLVEVRGKSQSRSRTPISSEPAAPRWDHTDEIDFYCVGNSLVFTVMDMDVLMDDVLGMAILSAEQIRAGFVGELMLIDGAKGEEAYLEIEVEGIDPSPMEHAAFTAARATRQARAVTAVAQRTLLDRTPNQVRKIEEVAIENTCACVFC